VRTSVVPNRRKSTLQAEVRKHVEAGAALYTDALLSYEGLATEYAHQVVDHAVQYVDGRVHTNGLENFWSLLKRGIKRNLRKRRTFFISSVIWMSKRSVSTIAKRPMLIDSIWRCRVCSASASYLDVGVITLESVDPTAGGIGDFAVISRLVMSRRTAIAIRDQLNAVLKSRESEDTQNAAP